MKTIHCQCADCQSEIRRSERAAETGWAMLLCALLMGFLWLVSFIATQPQ